MSHPPSNEMTPAAALMPIFLCIIFGGNAVAMKICFAGIGVYTGAGLRFALASAAVAIWARLSGRRFRLAKTELKPVLIISGCFTLQISLFYLGLSQTLASRASLVINVVPFLVLIFAHFFIPEDAITLRKFTGMILGFGGVALILADVDALGGGLRTGDLLVLSAAIIWAGNAVYTKTVIYRFQPFQLVLYPMIGAVPITFMEGWLWDPAMIHYVDGSIVATLLYQSLLSAAFGFVAWNSLIQRYGASVLHSFVFIVPVVGVIAGGLVLHEPITSALVAAVILVAAGIGLVNLKPRKPTPVFPVRRWF